MTQAAPPARLFTLAEANATLPLVRAITSDLARLSREVLDRKQRLEFLAGERETGLASELGSDLYWDELRQVGEELAKEALRLREYVVELEQLGIEVKDPVRGSVEFPALIEHQKAFLCWELGEAEVAHWRAAGDRFARRRPISVRSVGSVPVRGTRERGESNEAADAV